MNELESLLLDIPLDEREEALKYYNGYFEDAGEDHESEIIAELGSPKKVADMIKADLISNAAERDNRGYFTENGYKDTIVNEEQLEVIGAANTNAGGSQQSEQTAGAGNSQTTNQSYNNSTTNNNTNQRYNNSNNNTSNNINQGYNNPGNKAHQDNNHNRNTNVGLIVLILAFTVFLPLTLSLIGVAIGLVATVLGLIFGFGAAGIALICAGIALFIAGLVQMSIPLIGLAFVGGGLVVFGIGMLLTMACGALCRVALPAMIKGFVNLCRMPFKDRSVMAA
jgi:uncharacterized membrane protein